MNIFCKFYFCLIYIQLQSIKYLNTSKLVIVFFKRKNLYN